MTFEIYGIIVSVFVFALGASIASFLGLLNYRVNRDFKVNEILFGRSVCDHCNTQLAWYELLPIVGWIFTFGKCRKCGSKITMLYPIYEFVLGFIFVVFYLTGQGFYLYPVAAFLYLFALSDLEYMEIPAVFVHIGLAYAGMVFLYFLVFNGSMAAVVIGLFLVLAIFLLNKIKFSFGIGDILILFMVSLVLNLDKYILFLITSVLLGGLTALMFMSFDRKILSKYIPFVPFILLGFVFTLIVKL